MPRINLNGNLIYNGDFEIAPPFTAATTSGNKWIDGTAAGSGALKAYGWSIINGAILAVASAQFDAAISHSGINSLRLSTGDAVGTITCGTYTGTAPSNAAIFSLLPATSYTLTAWIKTNNVATNSAFIDIREYNSAVSTLATSSTTKFTGTNSWTQVTKTFTTNASTAFGSLFLRNNVAGNIGDAWFDDIVLSTTALTARTVA